MNRVGVRDVQIVVRLVYIQLIMLRLFSDSLWVGWWRDGNGQFRSFVSFGLGSDIFSVFSSYVGIYFICKR